ncbi:hypothetical protein [Microbacterium sp. NPDC057650]|uniref:hypothetical protein n=1 Tax=unclassified Microbacterium TaxID=2609290 RepID=UPI00366BB3C9
MTTFDKRTLTEPVDRKTGRTEALHMLAATGDGVTTRRFAAKTWFIGVGTAVGMALVAAGAVLILGMIVSLLTGHGISPVSAVLAWAILAVPYGYRRIGRIVVQLRDTEDRWYRLRRFAQANGLTHELKETEPVRAAAIFARAEGPQLDDPVTGTSPRPFEVANLSFHIGGGQARIDVAMAYARFVVSAELPPMSLQSVTARGGAAWRVEKPQTVISVDEEFDRRFKVFCGPEDEAAVRAVLDAGTRGALLTVAGDADVQVIGQEVWFVARQDLRLQDPVVWEWVEDLSGLLDRGLDPRPGAATPDDDPARAERCRKLLRGAGAARPFLLGCLVPIVLATAVVVIGALVR